MNKSCRGAVKPKARKRTLKTEYYPEEEEGRTEGEASGRAAERLEMAKAMRSENINIETIIKISGLTREEIEKL